MLPDVENKTIKVVSADKLGAICTESFERIVKIYNFLKQLSTQTHVERIWEVSFLGSFFIKILLNSGQGNNILVQWDSVKATLWIFLKHIHGQIIQPFYSLFTWSDKLFQPLFQSFKRVYYSLIWKVKARPIEIRIGNEYKQPKTLHKTNNDIGEYWLNKNYSKKSLSLWLLFSISHFYDLVHSDPSFSSSFRRRMLHFISGVSVHVKCHEMHAANVFFRRNRMRAHYRPRRHIHGGLYGRIIILLPIFIVFQIKPKTLWLDCRERAATAEREVKIINIYFCASCGKLVFIAVEKWFISGIKHESVKFLVGVSRLQFI